MRKRGGALLKHLGSLALDAAHDYVEDQLDQLTQDQEDADQADADADQADADQDAADADQDQADADADAEQDDADADAGDQGGAGDDADHAAGHAATGGAAGLIGEFVQHAVKGMPQIQQLMELGKTQEAHALMSAISQKSEAARGLLAGAAGFASKVPGLGGILGKLQKNYLDVRGHLFGFVGKLTGIAGQVDQEADQGGPPDITQLAGEIDALAVQIAGLGDVSKPDSHSSGAAGKLAQQAHALQGRAMALVKKYVLSPSHAKMLAPLIAKLGGLLKRALTAHGNNEAKKQSDKELGAAEDEARRHHQRRKQGRKRKKKPSRRSRGRGGHATGGGGAHPHQDRGGSPFKPGAKVFVNPKQGARGEHNEPDQDVDSSAEDTWLGSGESTKFFADVFGKWLPQGSATPEQAQAADGGQSGDVAPTGDPAAGGDQADAGAGGDAGSPGDDAPEGDLVTHDAGGEGDDAGGDQSDDASGADQDAAGDDQQQDDQQQDGGGGGILGGIGGFVQGVIGKASGFASGLLGKVGGFASGIAGKIGGFAKGVLGKVGGFAKGVMGKVGGFAKGILGKVGGAAGGLFGKVGGFAKGIFGKLGGGMFGKIGKKLGGLFGGKKKKGGLFGKIGNFAKSIVGKFTKKGGFLSGVFGKLHGFADKIGGFLKSGNKFLGKAMSLAQKGMGFVNKVGDVAGKVSAMAGKAEGFLDKMHLGGLAHLAHGVGGLADKVAGGADAVHGGLDKANSMMGSAKSFLKSANQVTRKASGAFGSAEKGHFGRLAHLFRASRSGDGIDGRGMPDRVRMGSAFDEPQRLDVMTLSRMESFLGSAFHHVRVHTGPGAAEITKRYDAEAVTVRDHIFFAPGRFNPATLEGQKLIAHELTHVTQKGRANLDVRTAESEALRSEHSYGSPNMLTLNLQQAQPDFMLADGAGQGMSAGIHTAKRTRSKKEDSAPLDEMPDGEEMIDKISERVYELMMEELETSLSER